MPIPLSLPKIALTHFREPALSKLYATGDRALLAEPLVGLLCSRSCPGQVILETIDRVPEWVKSSRVIVSGFHSPLEQQVLRSTWRRKGRAIKVLARALQDLRISSAEREAIDDKRMLLISCFPPEVRRITRETSLVRNRLVAALCTELMIPYATAGGELSRIAEEFKTKIR